MVNDANDSDAEPAGSGAGETDWYTVNTDRSDIWAGYCKYSSISGKVWFDKDGDGSQVGESFTPKPAGVKVTLFASEDGKKDWKAVRTETVTDTDDAFAFEGLKSGYYKVGFDRKDLSSATESYRWTVAKAAGVAEEDNSDATYGNKDSVTAETAPILLGYNTVDSTHQDAGLLVRLNHISGMVWEDRNLNGLKPSSAKPGDADYENPLAVVVVLYQSLDNDKTWKKIATTYSNAADGSYEFYGNPAKSEGLETGPDVLYRVGFGKPDKVNEWKYTAYHVNHTWASAYNSDVFYSNGYTDNIKLAEGGNEHINAGEFRLSTISGVVWRDENFDGIRQPGEAGCAGVSVSLSYNNIYGMGVSVSVTTDENGVYVFDGLVPSRANSNYNIRFDRKDFVSATELYKWSPPHMGSDGTVDSDAVYENDAKTDTLARHVSADDPATAGIDEAKVPYGTDVKHIDAGITPYLQVRGFAWHDDDYDGERIGAEAGFPNVAVKLHKDGAQVAQTVTGADGSYLFDDILISGSSYKVSFDNPDYGMYRFTRPGTHHTASDLRGAVAGNVHYYREAHTEEAVLSGHSTDVWNAGLNETPWYTVTYRPNGGSGHWGAGNYVLRVQAGSPVPNQIVTREGHDFLGWLSSDYLGRNWNFASDLMPERNIVLDALWDTRPIIVPPVTPPVPPVNPPTPPRRPPGPDMVYPTPDDPGDGAGGSDGPDGGAGTVKKRPGAAGQGTKSLGDSDTPGWRGVAHWSLLSLLMSATAVVVSLLLIIGYVLQRRRKRDDEEEDEEAAREAAVAAEGGVAGAAGVAEVGGADGEEEEEKKERKFYKRSMALRILTMFFGVLTPIVFFWLDNMKLPMDWINRWTIYVAIVFLVHLLSLLAYRLRRIRQRDEEEEEEEAAEDAIE
jgi:uncharacterized membrane protein